MKMGELITEERELIFRSLVLCGVHIVVSLSNVQGRINLSESDLSDQDVKEIHLMNPVQYGVVEKIEELGFKFKGIVDKWHVFAPLKNVLHNKGFSGSFKFQDIVQLNMAYGKSSAGTMAFVIDNENGKITFVTKDNMENIHVSEREAIDHLIYISSQNSFTKFTRP